MKMTLQECVQSKAFRWGVIIIGVLSVALVSFSAGLAVGLHKARFSYAWGENYEQNFLGRSRGMMEDKMMGKMEDGRGFRNPHGTMGTVLSVADDSLLLKNREGDQESNVRITEKTLILKQRETIAREALEPGVSVMVVGKPASDGVVVADFIRVFEDSKGDARGRNR